MEEDQPLSAMHETCSQPLQVPPYFSAPNACPKGTKRLILQSDLLTEQCKILEKFSLLGCVSGGTLPHAELVQWACVHLHSSFQSIEMREGFFRTSFSRATFNSWSLPSQCTCCRSLGQISKIVLVSKFRCNLHKFPHLHHSVTSPLCHPLLINNSFPSNCFLPCCHLYLSCALPHLSSPHPLPPRPPFPSNFITTHVVHLHLQGPNILPTISLSFR